MKKALPFGVPIIREVTAVQYKWQRLLNKILTVSYKNTCCIIQKTYRPNFQFTE